MDLENFVERTLDFSKLSKLLSQIEEEKSITEKLTLGDFKCVQNHQVKATELIKLQSHYIFSL